MVVKVMIFLSDWGFFVLEAWLKQKETYSLLLTHHGD